LEAFRKLGIPYEVAREKEFYRQREVVEAAALLRCVLDPADRLALLTVIRSDVVGVPDAALAPLWDSGFPDLMGQLGGEGGVDLGDLDRVIALAEAETPINSPAANFLTRWPLSLRSAAYVIAELRRTFEADPADRFVERVRTSWLAEVSASARFLGRFRRARLDRFYLDFERRLAQGDGGISGLARYLRQAVKEGQVAEVSGEPDLRANAVHVMTIHGAKGLDFKHVYLMQIHRQSGRGENTNDPKVLPLGGRREYRIFGWPTPNFVIAEELKNRQSRAEMIRLLYVAMTRAKDRLVVTGGWSKAPEGKNPLRAASFANLVDTRVDAEELAIQVASKRERRFEDGRHTQWIVPALGAGVLDDATIEPVIDHGLRSIAEVHRDAGILAAARTSARQRMERPLVGGASSLKAASVVHHDEEEGATPVVFESDGGVSAAVGSAVHRMLERLSLDGNLAVQLRAMIGEATDELRKTLDEHTWRGARSRLESVVEVVAEGVCLKTLAAVAGGVVGREVAVVAEPEVESGPISAVTGFVDLIYRDPEDGLVVVADYKTDVVADDDAVKERVRVYEPQVRTYARAIRRALDLDHDPHVELWFLWFDKIIRL
jgi:ATP-dependent helicase/nuclease subunit A